MQSMAKEDEHLYILMCSFSSASLPVRSLNIVSTCLPSRTPSALVSKMSNVKTPKRMQRKRVVMFAEADPQPKSIKLTYRSIGKSAELPNRNGKFIEVDLASVVFVEGAEYSLRERSPFYIQEC
jgi:hypothetical protein